jgi:hypothetical protein
VTLPWPCRTRARSPRGGNATFSVTLSTPSCTPSRSHQPTAGAVLAAAHGNEPGSAVHPCVPVSTGTSPTRLTMHKRNPRSTHGRSSMGRPHQHRVVAAAPVPAPTTPRTPSPLSCATRRVSTPRGVHGLPGGVQAPSAVEPRRRQGRIPPPPPQALFVEHLGCPRKTVAGDVGTLGPTRGSDRSRSARIWCGPPLSSRPHTGPHGSKPHRPPLDPVWLASSRPRRSAGRRDLGRTRDPGIPCGWPC